MGTINSIFRGRSKEEWLSGKCRQCGAVHEWAVFNFASWFEMIANLTLYSVALGACGLDNKRQSQTLSGHL